MMDFTTVDLNLLPHLAALLDTASVSSAARQCRVSQPAMSRSLARLREALGDPLLVRSGARMRVTPQGEALRAPVAALLAQIGDFYRPASFDPMTAERTFLAAIPDAVAATVLAPLLAALAVEGPGCRLALIPWPRAGDPAARTLDLAIATEPDLFPGFRMKMLGEDHDVLVAASTRARRLARLDIAGMLALRHVAVRAAGFPADPVDRWLAGQGLSRVVAATVPHYLQAALLVARSDRVAILPSKLVAALAAPLELAAIELPIAQPPDRQWLLYPVEREDDPGALWLRTLVRRIFDA